MRKINLIILLATVLIATSLRASGNGSGSTKANSIEFDWTTGVVHSGDKLWIECNGHFYTVTGQEVK